MVEEQIRKTLSHEGHELQWEKGQETSYLTVANKTHRECVAVTYEQLTSLRDFLVAALREIDRAPSKRKSPPKRSKE